MIRKLLLLNFLFWAFIVDAQKNKENTSRYIQFVFTSDVHYGLVKKEFRGEKDVPAQMVNRAMIAQINQLPDIHLPEDKGAKSGYKIGSVDFIVITGDLANRQEPPCQTATISWNQFSEDYFKRLTLKTSKGTLSPLYILPGNHDVSNAIGFHRLMEPKADASSMAGIYNAMLKPVVPKTKSTFNYSTDKINYSRDISGVHFVYLNVWPDEENRKWLANDLKKVDPKTPVLLFEHDPPAGDYKHFTNPNGKHDINENDKYENIVSEYFQPGGILTPQSTDKTERGLVAFLKAHPNIKAFFHGHNNWTEYYNYKGPDKDLSIPTFRVDSPMKGRNSAEEEKKLSFEFVVIDTQTGQMTVRECFWNMKKNGSKKSMEWGDEKTVSIK